MTQLSYLIGGLICLVFAYLVYWMWRNALPANLKPGLWRSPQKKHQQKQLSKKRTQKGTGGPS